MNILLHISAVLLLWLGLCSSEANSKVSNSHQSRVLGGRTPPNAIPDRCKKRGFLELFPFFRDVPLRYRSQEMALLIEFSRFANQRAPLMLKDFVSEKKIYQARSTVDNLAAFTEEDHDAMMALLDRQEQRAKREGGGSDLTGLELAKAHKMVRTLTESVEEATRQFSDIVHSIGESLHDVSSGELWDSACKTHWWPFEDDVCMHLRCTACTPAVASAAAVCNMSGQKMSHRCMQKVMGEGYCNYCIVEFTDAGGSADSKRRRRRR